MRNLRTYTAAMALLATLAPAYAADPYSSSSGGLKDTPIVPPTWTGFYVGAHGGWAVVPADAMRPAVADARGACGMAAVGMDDRGAVCLDLRADVAPALVRDAAVLRGWARLWADACVGVGHAQQG
jgi:hypothetical protein